MLLAIDVGNSIISVGLFSAEKELKFLASIDTDRRKTADQISIDLMNIFFLHPTLCEDNQKKVTFTGQVQNLPSLSYLRVVYILLISVLIDSADTFLYPREHHTSISYDCIMLITSG